MIAALVSPQLRRAVVESPRSLGARSRMRRWQEVRRRFGDLADLRVVDLGGTVDSWVRAPMRPAHVTVVNLFEPGTDPPPWITPVRGDACDPSTVPAGSRADLVFSNSLIEHVGGHAKRRELADAVRALADRYWVQTPYRYFPLEPHFLVPGFAHLPLAARARLLQRWPLVHTPPADRRAAVEAALDVELLGRTELAHYFPEAEVLADRVGPLVKSLVAVRS